MLGARLVVTWVVGARVVTKAAGAPAAHSTVVVLPVVAPSLTLRGSTPSELDAANPDATPCSGREPRVSGEGTESADASAQSQSEPEFPAHTS